MSQGPGDKIRITYAGSTNCEIVPEEAHTQALVAVTWEAIETDVTLFFPNHDLFGQSELFIPKGQTRTLTVLAGVSNGTYPYSVFCHAGNCFGKGDAGNEPVLIIP